MWFTKKEDDDEDGGENERNAPPRHLETRELQKAATEVQMTPQHSIRP